MHVLLTKQVLKLNTHTPTLATLLGRERKVAHELVERESKKEMKKEEAVCFVERRLWPWLLCEESTVRRRAYEIGRE